MRLRPTPITPPRIRRIVRVDRNHLWATDRVASNRIIRAGPVFAITKTDELIDGPGTTPNEVNPGDTLKSTVVIENTGGLGLNTLFSDTPGDNTTLVVGSVTALGSFKSAAALVGFTSFWDGVTYVTLFGIGGLAIAAWAYQALPAMTGREVASPELVRRHLRYTISGVGLTGLLLMVAGVVQGYSWSGDAFSGVVAAGETWANSSGTATVLIGLAVLTGALALAGQLAFVLVVYRTITSGRATMQEVLVERRPA